MDDEFFSDDEAFEDLGENELAALEQNAVLECTQAPIATIPLNQQQQQSRHGSLSAAANAPTIRQTARQYSYHQPTPQWSQTTNYRIPQVQTNYGGATIPTLRDVTLRTPQHSQASQHGVASAAPAEFKRFAETTELWDTAGPATKGQSQYNSVAQRQQNQERDEEVYDDNDYDEGELDDVLEAAVGPKIGEGNMMNAGGKMEEFHQQQAQTSAEIRQLQEKIANLEAKVEQYHQALAKAEGNILAKQGEISIVRNNIAKSNREHERLVQSLQALQNEEKERYERELKAAKAETEAMRTRNMFLNNDYEEVLRKNKALERSLNVTGDASRAQESPITTPKKKKALPYADGFFDDDEIMVSPGRSHTRIKPTTPSKKRKRLAFDSPRCVLPLSPSRRVPSAMETTTPLNVIDEATLEKLWQVDHRFDFFETIIAHRSLPGNIRTLEALSRLSLPSTPDTSLASLFFDHINALKATTSSSQFPTEVCKALLLLWRGILNEAFWAPFHLIIDLIHFAVMWDHGGVSIGILDDAVDLITRTVEVNAMPRVKRGLGKIIPDIDVNKCLTLMDAVALGALAEENHVRRFWKLVGIEFVLLMCDPSQPIHDIELMLSMLCTSVFCDSFGPQVSNQAQQRQNETLILNAATRLLIEAPDMSGEEESAQRSKVVELRKEVLRFLGCVVGMETGTKLIADHPTALPKLVRRIADELEVVYDFRWNVGASVEFVNAAVRLLHGILMTNKGLQLGTKLTGGANHKHLVAMTRLAFSVGLVQEAGIEEEVVEYAHAILEQSVTPQEGEALQGLFPPYGKP